MKDSKKNNSIQKIIGDDYEHFCIAAGQAAEEDTLPVNFLLEDIGSLTCKDIADFCNKFECDTGLEMTASLYICRECGEPHIIFIVDYMDENYKVLVQ